MAKKKGIQDIEAAKKATGFIAEFRAFIARGNVIDMAVGVIIGGAFGSISTSLVNDVIMPLISLLTGGINFDDWKFVLKAAVVEEGAVVSEAVTVNYGAFLSTVLNFLIVAFAVFLMIKVMNNAAAIAKRKKEEEEKVEEAPKLTVEQELLTEIRDLLKSDAAPAQSNNNSGGGKKGKRK